jgi:hypothetical protein
MASGGANQSNLSKAERGTIIPSFDTFESIESFYDAPPGLRDPAWESSRPSLLRALTWALTARRMFRVDAVATDRAKAAWTAGMTIAEAVATADESLQTAVRRTGDLWPKTLPGCRTIALADTVPLWVWLLYYDASWAVDGQPSQPTPTASELLERLETLRRSHPDEPTDVPPLTVGDMARIRASIQTVADYWESALATGRFGDPEIHNPVAQILETTEALIAMESYHPATVQAIWRLVTDLQAGYAAVKADDELPF